MRWMSAFLGGFVLFLNFEETALASVHANDLEAPEGYFWSETITKDQIHLELWSRLNRQKTKIQFVYDVHSGTLISSTKMDDQLKLLLPAPGEHLWSAHPEKFESVENHFRKLLKDLQLLEPKTTEKVLSLDDEGQFRYRNADDLLEQVPATPVPNLNLQEIINSVQRQITTTEQKWTQFSSGVADIQSLVSALDVIEPIETEFPGDGRQIEAFNLFPLVELEKDGETMLRALSSLAQTPKRYPLEWLIGESSLPFHTRLAILMLLTHNHQIEENFTKAVVIQFGVRSAWKTFLDLNSLYKNERDFWTPKSQHQIRNDLESFYPSFGISFLDETRTWEINIAYKQRILGPLYGFHSLTRQNIEVFLPYRQIYHYYGAFVLALRLKEDLGIPDVFIPKMAELLGMGYKLKTAGSDANQLHLMQAYYLQGAHDALAMSRFIR